MMKKEYLTPEMIVRHVILEGFMELSVPKDESGDDAPGDGWGLEDADSKSIGDKSFDVWED